MAQATSADTDVVTNPETGLCPDCTTGFTFQGTPKGVERKIGPFSTVYVASPENVANPQAAIVLFTDIFGLNLVNSRLISDRLAEGTGVTVYTPDLFYGHALAPDAIVHYDTADEVRKRGLLDKVKGFSSRASIVPWFMKHRPATKTAAVNEFMAELKKPEFGYSKFGAVGYCYGAKIVAELNTAGTTVCSVFAHPSLLDKHDLSSLTSPSTFALAELDDSFSDSMRQVAELHLNKNKIDSEFVVYPGTTHGFAARGNLSIEIVKEGFEGAFAQTASWFRKNLLD